MYIVAIPIGNMADITLRALDILRCVDIIAAEDTRHAAALLKFYTIGNRLISYHDHNEDKRAPGLIDRLKRGAAVALISEAGTPMVSDPGYRLVKKALENGIPVVPIPGVSALVTALTASGLATDAFVFIGFLDRKKNRRLEQIRAMKNDRRTHILYESPRRIMALLAELIDALEDRNAVLAREMTKPHEEFIRGPLSGILTKLEKRGGVKGECTLVIDGGDDRTDARSSLREEIVAALDGTDAKPAVMSKQIAEKLGMSKQAVYDEIVKIKHAR
ncbi:MAG: 16S rRNA (cytidine(1402)-2'-O)-methyltransferase [Desulfobacterales bacterium]